VHALLRRLGEDHMGHKYTETVPKLGYRFVAEVRVIEDGNGAGAGQDAIARS
jgi:DNA-binding winged helix-turn-helix (wHTH) protein